MTLAQDLGGALASLREMARGWRYQCTAEGQGPAGNKARRKCADEVQEWINTHSAEIAGALRDADRYRKLKEHFSARYHRATMDYWVLDGEVKTASQFFTDEIDLTLDAALDAMQQGGGGVDHG